VKESEKRKTKLKELIQQANLTQRELSDRVGLTEKTINDLVRGVSFPRLDRAANIARILGVSFKELCDALGISVEGIPDDHSENQNAERGNDTFSADE
jgi:transcriptional regulator with XRE-family HTH domain